VRQSLAAPKLINQGGDGSASLLELLTSLVLATVEKVKSVVQDLLVGSFICVFYIDCHLNLPHYVANVML
jgi:hypothetical protein